MHALFQNISPCPTHAVDFSNHKLVGSCLHWNTFYKTIQIFNLIILFFFLIPTSIWRLSWLCFHWKSYTVNNFVQIIIYMYYISITFIFVSAFRTQQEHTQEFEYVSNQLASCTNNIRQFLTIVYTQICHQISRFQSKANIYGPFCVFDIPIVLRYVAWKCLIAICIFLRTNLICS